MTNPTLEVAAEASATSVQELSASTFDATKARRQSVVIIRRFLRHRLAMICLFAISFALYSRFQRGSMLDVLNSDYVRTAQAKGLSQTRVIFRHAFRNALIPVVTVAALNIGAVFSGAIITERVFNWQGMGTLIVNAVQTVEPWMVLGWLVVTAIFIILFNLIADILYAYLDPRIRLD